jgi:hypothetical protein
LVRRAIESRANICFAVRQCGERNPEGIVRRQPIKLIQQQADDALVLACAAFRDRIPLDRLEF